MKVVSAIVKNIDNNKYLLRQISKKDDTKFAGKWMPPGGKFEPGENYEAAIKRELKEKFDLDEKYINSCEEVLHYDKPVERVIIYVETNASLNDMILNEGSQMKFFSKEELFEKEYPYDMKDVLKEFFEKKK